jgi:superfamily II DNA/RNA helicase
LDEQPMLDVINYDVQKKASEMLNDCKKHQYHLIFDEVGTGKTVSALYCIRNSISKAHSKAKILIVCPNNKKSEWQKDIKRQLGLYAHIVENNADQGAYEGEIKNIYFKENEPAIFIEGQKSDQKNGELDKWSENIKWDLIVIDEGHQCFSNYRSLKAKQAILLTATPIVVNSTRAEGTLLTIEPNDYIKLLSDIVDENSSDPLNNLFEEQDVFTQLFREDLGIIPKKRKISYITCERLEKRNDYLDVLADVKGGMTRLMYEQDDDMLIYGVFEKFKQEIKKAGYIIDEVEPIKNTKQNKLIDDYLEKEENKKKSYIIFFNSKWPAESLYKKLVDKNLRDTIVAVKFGGKYCKVWPKENSVTADNIFDYLQGQIALDKRVLFITTGASGGTGLNLGKFDGVINYELPFTSIELEQRFGRVDRMDNSNNEDKEMVFIFNDDANPMLRYALLKINKTCEYMPVRNTILFCKQVMEELKDSLERELKTCILTDSEKTSLVTYSEKYKMADPSKNKEVKKLLNEIFNCIAKKRKLDELDVDIEEYSDSTRSFILFFSENYKDIASLHHKSERLTSLESEIDHWCNLIGTPNIEDDIEDDIEINSYSVADDETEYEEYDYNPESDIVKNNLVLIKEERNKEERNKEEPFIICNMKQVYDESVKKLDRLKDSENYQVATGLFYIKHGKYCRKTVDEYRNEYRKESEK